MRCSVIIPMYNSENTIIETLSGLAKQTRQDFEVIVVDDGSTDRSSNLVEEYKKSSELNIKLIKQENLGPAKARNKGVENAKSDIILFLDSDCIPIENWLEEMTKPISKETVGCSCRYKVKNKGSLIARYIDYEIARRHEKMAGKVVDTIGSYSACYLKDVFDKVGGFNTSYRIASGEDFDLSFKIGELGYKLKFINTTFVYHYHPETLRKYLKQQFMRGYWRVEMYLRSKEKILSRESYSGYEAQIQFILSSAVLISLPMSVFKPLLLLISVALLLSSNIPLGVWCFKKERKFLVIAPILASLRSLVGTLGAYFYLIKKV